MMSHKSPSVPFTLMLTRFKEGWIVENFNMLGYIIIPTAPGNKIHFHWSNHMSKKAQLRLCGLIIIYYQLTVWGTIWI